MKLHTCSYRYIARLGSLVQPLSGGFSILLDNNFSSKVYVSFSHSVPPLTEENILEAVNEVQNWALLKNCFGIHPASSIEDAVEGFLLGRGRYQPPSWRAVIFTLDVVGETQIADRIRNHGEPVQGVCVCVCI